MAAIGFTYLPCGTLASPACAAEGPATAAAKIRKRLLELRKRVHEPADHSPGAQTTASDQTTSRRRTDSSEAPILRPANQQSSKPAAPGGSAEMLREEPRILKAGNSPGRLGERGQVSATDLSESEPQLRKHQPDGPVLQQAGPQGEAAEQEAEIDPLDATDSESEVELTAGRDYSATKKMHRGTFRTKAPAAEPVHRNPPPQAAPRVARQPVVAPIRPQPLTSSRRTSQRLAAEQHAYSVSESAAEPSLRSKLSAMRNPSETSSSRIRRPSVTSVAGDRPGPTLADDELTEDSLEESLEDSPSPSSSRIARHDVGHSASVRESDSDKQLQLALEGPVLTAVASGPKRIVVGQPASYAVTIRNSGQTDASDVVVSVQMPASVNVAETQPSRGALQEGEKTETHQTVQWRLDRLAAGSREEIKLELIPRGSQPLDLSVRWTYAHAGLHTLVDVEEPLLNMSIAGPDEVVYGQTKMYTLTVSNPGTGDAENVVLSLLPVGAKQEQVADQNMGTLRRGETKTIQVELAAGEAGTLLVQAQATASGGLNAEATKEVLVRRAALKIDASSPHAQFAGNTVNYRIRVANLGNAPAEEATLTALLPSGAEFVSASHNGSYENGESRVQWDIGTLAAGQELLLDLACTVNVAGANQLELAIGDQTDLTASTIVSTEVIARADLKLTVSDPQGPILVGDTAEYELTIYNRGTKSAEGVEAVVFFSEGIEPTSVVGAEHEIGRGQVIFQALPAIEPGCELKLTVKARADRPGNHVFRAEVLCRALGTKLAAEETTHFYDQDFAAEGEPNPPSPQPETPAPAPPRYAP